MGLIYVNPEGVDGKPDPLKRTRCACYLRAYGNERRRNCCPDGPCHTVGKAHGNGDGIFRTSAEAADVEDQGLGWNNKTSEALVVTP